MRGCSSDLVCLGFLSLKSHIVTEMEMFGCAASPAGQGFDSLQQQGRNHEEKPLLSGVLQWWSVCLNELLMLPRKLHKPFYFERILLRPDRDISLQMNSAQLACAFCFLPGAVPLGGWHQSQMAWTEMSCSPVSSEVCCVTVSGGSDRNVLFPWEVCGVTEPGTTWIPLV